MSNSMLIRCAIPVIILLTSKNFHHVSIFNCFLQFILFIVTANIPALVTGRMSYVDVAWPFGLVTIGLMPILNEVPFKGLRPKLIMIAYLVSGLRMGLGATLLFLTGRLQQEFPRYLYLREIIWAKKGITDESSFDFKISMQKDILVQCLCNMGALCMPMMIQGFGYNSEELTYLEIFGWILWYFSIMFEHTADRQKKRFIKDCKEKNINNAVCDVGLWRYSRHPNYFGEWMVWNSLIITSLPSLLALWQTPDETILVKIGMTWGLFSISWMMYTCLVHYTGAAPAEYYSVKKRPDYVKYQKTVNMFIPGPRKSLAE